MAQRKRPRTKRTVYEQTSRRMLNDARFLLKHGRWHSGVYLAGYAVECRLKAAVCQFISEEILPSELQTHDLWTLLVSAGLEETLQSNQQMKTYFDNLCLESHFQIEFKTNLLNPSGMSKFVMQQNPIDGTMLRSFGMLLGGL